MQTMSVWFHESRDQRRSTGLCATLHCTVARHCAWTPWRGWRRWLYVEMPTRCSSIGSIHTAGLDASLNFDSEKISNVWLWLHNIYLKYVELMLNYFADLYCIIFVRHSLNFDRSCLLTSHLTCTRHGFDMVSENMSKRAIVEVPGLAQQLSIAINSSFCFLTLDFAISAKKLTIKFCKMDWWFTVGGTLVMCTFYIFLSLSRSNSGYLPADIG